MDSTVLTILQNFASGAIPPQVFRDHLYANPAFETFLSNDPNLKQEDYVHGSAYLFLLQCDLDSPEDVLDAHGAVCDFLDRNGYGYSRTNEYSEFFDLVLKCSPGWAMPDAKYVKEHLMPNSGGRTGQDLQKWLKQQLKERYRYVSKPPEWIQSPDWPHGSGGPLVFLGQFDVSGYFHDLASVYVFHDPTTGECQTIIQCF